MGDRVHAYTWTVKSRRIRRAVTSSLPQRPTCGCGEVDGDSRGEVIEAEAEIIREMSDVPPVCAWRNDEIDSARSQRPEDTSAGIILEALRALIDAAVASIGPRTVGSSILLLAFVMGHQPIIAARRRTRCSRSCHPAC